MGGGGGKGGGSSAKTPDYMALAQQQGQINQQTAQYLTEANRANQLDPYGNSIQWTQEETPEYKAAQARVDSYKQEIAANPWWDQAWAARELKTMEDNAASLKGKGKWTQTQTLNPEQLAANQQIIKQGNEAAIDYGGILNKFLNDYTSKGKTQDDFNGQAVSDALYRSVMDRSGKTQARDTDALNTQLRQQGLQPGSEAYNRAMQNLMTSQNDANNLAAQNATLAGYDESRKQYQSYLQGRNQPIQELSGLAGIASGQPYQPSYGNYSQATGYQPTDLLGAAGAQAASQQNAANGKANKKSGLLGSATSLGGSYLGSK